MDVRRRHFIRRREMNSFRLTVLACAMVAGLLGSEANAVNIETVPVGNPGNAPDTTGFGAVSYSYQMGKFEVTAAQYCEFLNAVARTDSYGLYEFRMAADQRCGGCNIVRSGSSGSYAYTVAADWANRPVNWVNWASAARFANWLTNGQPATGVQDATTTEDGSYCLNGAIYDQPILAVQRKANARYVIPNQNEWYKAAYHKNDGVTGHYWLYPMGSNTLPSNILSSPDPGNNGNFYDIMGTGNLGSTLVGPYGRTPVGAFTNSDSPYGTFDQGGNVWEYIEDSVPYSGSQRSRASRGSGYAYESSFYLGAQSAWIPTWPTSAGNDSGFRVAYVPEPATLVLLSLGCFAALRRRGL
jgi:formylglycine-generating enzyme required for sulfatase activity